MFKVGDKVRCIDTELGSDITLGKVYTVIKAYSNTVRILDDCKDEWDYSNHRFELVEEAKPTTEFQVGDIVEIAGIRGKVTSINVRSNYPVEVHFGDLNRDDHFTLDGRAYVWHKKPLLELIERPKKKEKRQVFVDVYYSPSLDTTFAVDSQTLPSDAQLVTVGGEVEVEV